MTALNLRAQTEQIIQKLKQTNATIGFAESCTGGLLSAKFAEIPGVSEVFKGSVVSYSNEIKAQILGVSEESLKKYGAVSEQVAREMAKGVYEKLGVTWSLAITGIAGPGGGSPEKPVGTVWIAVLGPGLEVQQKQLFSGDRRGIQNQSIEKAIEILLQHM